MIITDQISDSIRDRIIGILLSKHCHHHQQQRLQRRFSLTSLNSLDFSKHENLHNNTSLAVIDTDGSQPNSPKHTENGVAMTSPLLLEKPEAMNLKRQKSDPIPKNRSADKLKGILRPRSESTNVSSDRKRTRSRSGPDETGSVSDRTLSIMEEGIDGSYDEIKVSDSPTFVLFHDLPTVTYQSQARKGIIIIIIAVLIDFPIYSV